MLIIISLTAQLYSTVVPQQLTILYEIISAGDISDERPIQIDCHYHKTNILHVFSLGFQKL